MLKAKQVLFETRIEFIEFQAVKSFNETFCVDEIESV